jgi:hypothetical protein
MQWGLVFEKGSIMAVMTFLRDMACWKQGVATSALRQGAAGRRVVAIRSLDTPFVGGASPRVRARGLSRYRVRLWSRGETRKGRGAGRGASGLLPSEAELVTPRAGYYNLESQECIQLCAQNGICDLSEKEGYGALCLFPLVRVQGLVLRS